MKTSPIRFDDLAFILLFFFMIVAVVSFSNSAVQESRNTATDMQAVSEEETESITVFLDKDGNLSQSEFRTGSLVELECDPEIKWQTIQNAIHFISEQNVTVNLVVQ